MTTGQLSEYFTGVASKRLRVVEVDPNTSNQHEFNGVNGLREILGAAEPQTFDARFLYLTDERDEPEVADRSVTWYDSRRNVDHRSAEYRLYFPASSVMEMAREGDLLTVARRREGGLLIVVVEAGTTVENQVRWLFGLADPQLSYTIQTEQQTDEISLDFTKKLILEQIGVEIEDTADDHLEEMIQRFGGVFPTTRKFSAFARETMIDCNPLNDPDDVLLLWMEREEQCFRTLERHIVRERLQQGFGEDVDDFISFSLSVQNRRKSRAGHALQNHLMTIFDAHGLRYDSQARTENNTKPDYLFPGEKEYRDEEFPSNLLTMLGVKTSCKDRWRQVLSEAKRIPEKHLLTLEAGISENQTDEMFAHHLRLIIPSGLHATFTASQRNRIIQLGEFIELIQERQQLP